MVQGLNLPSDANVRITKYLLLITQSGGIIGSSVAVIVLIVLIMLVVGTSIFLFIKIRR